MLFYHTSGIWVALWKAVAMATTKETPAEVLKAANFAVDEYNKKKAVAMATAEVLKAANFAVDECNKKEKRSLIFVQVLFSAKISQIYFMILECADGKSNGYYAVIVADLILVKQLLYFTHVIGWTNVKYLESSIETEKYSRFAVDEYNKEQKRRIKFRRVVAAQQQEGVNYRLIIECEDANYIKLYEVNEKRLKEFESLDFQQVIDALKTMAGPEWAKMQPEHVGY